MDSANCCFTGIISLIGLLSIKAELNIYANCEVFFFSNVTFLKKRKFHHILLIARSHYHSDLSADIFLLCNFRKRIIFKDIIKFFCRLLLTVGLL